MENSIQKIVESGKNLPITILDRMNRTEKTGNHIIHTYDFNRPNIRLFLEKFQKARQTNSQINMYLIAKGTVLTTARKKFRAEWEDITLGTLGRYTAHED